MRYLWLRWLLVLGMGFSCSPPTPFTSTLVAKVVEESQEILDSKEPFLIRKSQAHTFILQNLTVIREYSVKNWGEARILFDGLSSLNFYLQLPELNTYLVQLYTQLNHFQKDSDRETIVNLFYQGRQWDEWKNFLSSQPDWQVQSLKSPPKIVTQKKFLAHGRVLSLNGKSQFTVENFDSKAFSGVVMVGSSNCHFTTNAIKALYPHFIARNTDTSKIVVLGPQEAIDTESLAEWNRLYPKTPLKHVYLASEHPTFDFSSFPKFYFLKHGHIQSEMIGWPKEGKTQLFFEKLAKTL